ncbi:hypothetical protein AADZ90_013195 [Aestuariibius sp. 2305UL40-4]|uniref:hypothetical protein n=1 Tax=Aestuariibius violaceus TaxID=3234132 RepID=UPI00345EF5AD
MRNLIIGLVIAVLAFFGYQYVIVGQSPLEVFGGAEEDVQPVADDAPADVVETPAVEEPPADNAAAAEEDGLPASFEEGFRSILRLVDEAEANQRAAVDAAGQARLAVSEGDLDAADTALAIGEDAARAAREAADTALTTAGTIADEATALGGEAATTAASDAVALSRVAADAATDAEDRIAAARLAVDAARQAAQEPEESAPAPEAGDPAADGGETQPEPLPEDATPEEIIDQALSGGEVDFARIQELVDQSNLGEFEKTALRIALEQARNNPEAFEAVLQQLQGALGR